MDIAEGPGYRACQNWRLPPYSAITLLDDVTLLRLRARIYMGYR